MYTYALVLFSQTHTVFCTLHSYSTISVGRKGTRRSLHSDCHKSGPNGLEINVIKASNEPHQAAQPPPPPSFVWNSERRECDWKGVAHWLSGIAWVLYFLYAPCDTDPTSFVRRSESWGIYGFFCANFPTQHWPNASSHTWSNMLFITYLAA